MAERGIPAGTHDVVIVGGGPAGLTTGLYAARANLNTVLCEGSGTVSQITITDLIENYPGLPDVTGFELINRFREQAIRFGLTVKAEEVLEIAPRALGDVMGWKVTTGGGEYRACAVIVATGAAWRRLGVPGEEGLIGKGVSFCATCDGPFYRNREVVVVGGGDTAVQEALFLTRFASRVTIVHRRGRLRATGVLRDRAFANKKIEFAWESVVSEIRGENAVTGVVVKSVKLPGDTREIPAEGAFIFIGLNPLTQLVRHLVHCDDGGYITVDSTMRTSAPGIFACGDCTKKSLRQVVTACGDGATAAHAAELYIDELKGQAY
ncbi:MAG: thioredoxin-disulfide reductase [Deltaproteobacteria bacterium]|nr:thioredoxin-disulfide reductase [Deltaproteobacteria bacterium]